MDNEKISKEDLLGSLEEKDSIVDHDFEYEKSLQMLDKYKNETLLDLQERKDIIWMRKVWSYSLLGAILFIVLFDMVIIMFLGFGLIDFESGYIAPLFVGEGLFKIFGLALIVVKFLFNEELLKKFLK